MTASDIAGIVGRRGGLARGKRLSSAQRRAIAAMGARARVRSLTSAQDIADNFRYVEAIRQLSGEPARIKRSHRPTGRLPRIYPSTL